MVGTDVDQTAATFQKVFSQASLMEAVRLLPWCISAVVPFCYISRVVTTATKQDKGILTMSEPCPTASESEPEPHGSLVPGSSRGLTPSETSPLPVSSLPDSLGHVLPWWGIPFPTS